MSFHKVITGDCLAVLPTIRERVDAIVTDPPFSSVTHEGARSFVATGKASTKGFADGDGSTALVDFDALTSDEFNKVVAAMLRVCSGWVVMTCDWRHAAEAEKAGLPLVRLGVWVKPDAAPQFTGDRPATGWEAVAMFHNEGKKQWNGGGRHAVWTYGRDRSQLHPSVKPLPMVREFIRLFSNEGDTILDPFAGSGTTLVAAKMEGRSAIGIEIDEGYAAIARRRIADAASLFHQPAREADPVLIGGTE